MCIAANLGFKVRDLVSTYFQLSHFLGCDKGGGDRRAEIIKYDMEEGDTKYQFFE